MAVKRVTLTLVDNGVVAEFSDGRMMHRLKASDFISEIDEFFGPPRFGSGKDKIFNEIKGGSSGDDPRENSPKNIG